MATLFNSSSDIDLSSCPEASYPEDYVLMFIMSVLVILSYTFLASLLIVLHVLARRTAKIQGSITPPLDVLHRLGSDGEESYVKSLIFESDLHSMYDEIPEEYIEHREHERHRKKSNIYTVFHEEEEQSFNYNKEADKLLEVLANPQHFNISSTKETKVNTLMFNMLRISGSIATGQYNQGEEEETCEETAGLDQASHHSNNKHKKCQRAISENLYESAQQLRRQRWLSLVSSRARSQDASNPLPDRKNRVVSARTKEEETSEGKVLAGIEKNAVPPPSSRRRSVSFKDDLDTCERIKHRRYNVAALALRKTESCGVYSAGARSHAGFQEIDEEV